MRSKYKRKKKCFYFIRSKVDQDIRNAKDDDPDPENFKEEDTLKEIRANCVENLRDGGFEDIPIFIISSKETDKWDFPSAVEKLTIDFPALKQEAIIFSLSNLSVHTENLIEMKKQILDDRARRVSLMAAASGVFPLEGIDVLLDMKILCDEKEFYRIQFGLDDKLTDERLMEGLAKSTKMQMGRNMSFLQLANNSFTYIVRKLAENAGDGFFADIVKVGGMVTNAFASYNLVLYTLRGILNEHADIARQVSHRFAVKARRDL